MPEEPKPLPRIVLEDWMLAYMGITGDPTPDPPPVEPVPPPPPPAPDPVPPPASPRPGQEEVFGLPVDPVAVAHAETVRRILNDTPSFQEGQIDSGSASVITVLTHPGGAITIGVSGHKLGTEAAIRALAGHPDLPPNTRIGPADVLLDPGGDNKPCGEVRAILGAQLPGLDGSPPPPPPTGMATIARDPTSKAARKFEDPANPGTLCPCPNCVQRGPALRPRIGVPPAAAPGG